MNFELSNDLWTTDFYFSAFLKMAKLYCDKELDTGVSNRQLDVIRYLTNLDSTILNTLDEAAYSYYARLDSIVDFSSEGKSISKSMIRANYLLTSVLIPQIRICSVNYFFLNFDCSWEEERGMQVLFASDKMLFCGESTSLWISSRWHNIITLNNIDGQFALINNSIWL
jgi:hypothetical protein